MKINVVGLGYIGLPTALMFASKGLNVNGTDLNAKLVKTLNDGKITFEENGLFELYQRAKENGISFKTELDSDSDVYIIAVATPYDNFTKKVDACYVCAAVENVLSVCKKGTIIVVESTVSPGTLKQSIEPIINKSRFKLNKDVFLAHAPERIIPGNMIYELGHNSRTIGADDEQVAKVLSDLYGKITIGQIVTTDIRSAEMTKVVENTFRAVNIAFANELAKICDYSGLDVYEIIKICNMHPRVKILQPGPGVGGHCISVDPWFLVGDYPSLTKVIGESMQVNASMPEYVLNKISNIAEENGIKDYSKIGLYGLTYKENVDDVRESPSLQLLSAQKKHLANGLKVYDPFIKRDIVDNQYHDLDAFLNDVEIVVVMVKHSEIIQEMDKLSGKIVFDTQNVINRGKVYKL